MHGWVYISIIALKAHIQLIERVYQNLCVYITHVRANVREHSDLL